MRLISRVSGWLLACSVLLLGSQAIAQGLPPELQQAWKSTRLQHGDVSLVVQEIGGPRLIEINPDLPRNPASVMKMVTTWAADSGLGTEYSWRTDLLSGCMHHVDYQVSMRGPLYIQAVEEPFMTHKEFWFLMRDLRLRGIK